MLEIELKNLEDFKKFAHRKDLYVEIKEDIYTYYVLKKNQDMEIVYSFKSTQPLKTHTFFNLEEEESLLVENIYEIRGIREVKIFR